MNSSIFSILGKDEKRENDAEKIILRKKMNMNKKIYIGLLSATMLLAACGGSGATDADDVSSSNSTANGTNLAAEADYSVESYESLPVCNDRKDGLTGYVKGTSKYYVCKDGEWVVTNKPSSPSTSTDEDDSSHDDGDVGKGKSSSSRSNSIPDFFGKSSESYGISVGGYDPSTGILTDARDGQKYKTTTIGTQVWMAQNLNYAYTGVKYNFYGYTSDSTSWCYLNDADNCEKYGRLYTWSAALDSAGVLKNDGKGKDCGSFVKCGVEGTVQGVCPSGWHLPSENEFRTLLESVGSNSGERYANLRAPSWNNGVNKGGFSALPAGEYYIDIYSEGEDGFFSSSFYGLGRYTAFLSISEEDKDGKPEFTVVDLVIDDNVGYEDYPYASVGVSRKFDGHSVRCLKDN